MKKEIAFILLVLCSACVVGQSLTKEFAVSFAAEFLNSNRDKVFSCPIAPATNKMKSAYRLGQSSVSSKDLHVVAATSNTMMVTSVDGGEFVMVGGSDAQPKVVGYGRQSGDVLPQSLSKLVASHLSNKGSSVWNAEWAREDGFQLPISPLVKSVRHQSEPFNNLCPYYIYDDGAVSLDRCLVGCVATATEQVLSYYSYPSALQDSIEGFYAVNSGFHPTIPKGTKIDYPNILDIYKPGLYTSTQATAVAQLSYYVGVACKMDWGVGSSGARVERLVEPLRSAFGYQYVRCVNSYDYSPRRWIGLLLNELANGRPIVYAGYSTNGGGHAFVVDGVDSDGFFHITWGYGGDYDGYFDLGVLTPQENPLEPSIEGSVFGLGHLQQALFMSPNPVDYVDDDTLSVAHRIEVDSVVFNRTPDTNMFVKADISVRNVSSQDVYSPIELITYSELDSGGFPADIDYLGLADGVVRANSDTTLTAYLQFRMVGERKLAVNTSDSLYLDFADLNVLRAYQPQLSFEVLGFDYSQDTASFRIGIKNLSKFYWSGRKLTYSVFEGDYTTDEGDWRHFRVINLPPLADMEDSVAFSHLKPDTRYTFVIRNPWNPALEYSFVTPDVTRVSNTDLAPDCDSKHFPIYRINHRIALIYDESTKHYRQVLLKQ